MWLINVDTLELEFHYQEGIKYAILSHVWGAEEVSFQEWKALSRWKKTAGSHNGPTCSCCNDIDVSAVLQKSGYHKILECCDQAKRDRFQFAWVDTCCIDKSSSAELSEAINSMFRWYGDSKACYVYLADVPPGTAISDPAFRASRWFTRGWTLQELLAPNNLGFFDADWNYLSDKSGNLHLLANITSIPPNCLNGNAGHTSVADRLSWASSRETTRPEDMAYCLLGILDVNMPLLYGEGGTKAFFRLQEEIIKTTDDETILSWGYKSAVGYAMSQVLASSPKAFARTEGTSIDIIRFAASAPFQMTNQGLQITLDVFEISSNVVYARLSAAAYRNDRFAGYLVLPLMPLRVNNAGYQDGDRFLRIPGGNPVAFGSCESNDGWKSRSIFITKSLNVSYLRTGLAVTSAAIPDLILEEIYPPTWTTDGRCMDLRGPWDTRVTQNLFLKYRRQNEENVYVVIQYNGVQDQAFHTRLTPDITMIRILDHSRSRFKKHSSLAQMFCTKKGQAFADSFFETWSGYDSDDSLRVVSHIAEDRTVRLEICNV